MFTSQINNTRRWLWFFPFSCFPSDENELQGYEFKVSKPHKFIADYFPKIFLKECLDFCFVKIKRSKVFIVICTQYFFFFLFCLLLTFHVHHGRKYSLRVTYKYFLFYLYIYLHINLKYVICHWHKFYLIFLGLHEINMSTTFKSYDQSVILIWMLFRYDITYSLVNVKNTQILENCPLKYLLFITWPSCLSWRYFTTPYMVHNLAKGSCSCLWMFKWMLTSSLNSSKIQL